MHLSLIHISVIILPNNSNIIMAANSAAELSETPCAVVPTKSVPQAFSALFAVDVDASLETNVEEDVYKRQPSGVATASCGARRLRMRACPTTP